ncbi:sigma-70 family RNA polymerase sigma factor [Phenylobacterium sp.]|jgi:RNA polymerase sigma-70 factor (ECF subfamily)|uniref:sigma-70 family RNA polymerase sigma factor n=1 Tax=Phenylobacterium sp. TaxID=1871053 RepID=UPI002E3430D2|nr:sigma-70 family RNA polymerase sigma factor [Phenylobacterium sp.]HEX3363666.1 sigma-70 family RNA polymerase sigma factor [Phenylobacterium sp.]
MAISGRKPFFRPHLAVGGAATPGRAAEAEQTRQFRELVLPHLDSAYNFARYLTRDADAAEDVVQDAFLRAFRAFPDYRGGAPKAWLFAIVRNCFLNSTRARKSSANVLVEECELSDAQSLALANISDPDQETPEEDLIRQRDATALRAVIENLPEPFRETLVLRELEELSYREIAALTSAPIGTVMSRLARARQMLCDMLLPGGDPSASSGFRETLR